MNHRPEVTLTVEGDEVIASQPELLTDRTARLFFRSLLGATPTESGWRCPRRRSPLHSLIVRINKFLESRGWPVARIGIVDQAVEAELARVRSFQRTQEKSRDLREGRSEVDPDGALRTVREFGWDEEARPLRDHQKVGLVHGLTAINAANFSVPGSGKTATTLAVAAAHLSSGTIDLLVVVGPLSSFAPWEKEARASLGTKLRRRRVRGTASERRAIYSSAMPNDLLLLSYSAAAADKQELAGLFKRTATLLVVDESHRVKRFRGGVWAPALIQIAEHARARIVLSGTPMPQSGRDLYTQLNILWPHQELTGPRDGFAVRVERDFGTVLREIQPFISRTPKAALGLRPYEISFHEVELSGTQAEIYELIESNFRRRIQDAETYRDKIEALRRGRPIRLLQAATNPDLLNRPDSRFGVPRLTEANPTLMQRLESYSDLEVPAKTVRGLELVRATIESSGKCVVWSNFLSNLDQFAARVRREIRVATFQVDGRIRAGDEAIDEEKWSVTSPVMEDETREQIIERFLSVGGAAVLVANPAACSESISLHQACHTAIYLDRTYDSAQFLQSIDRIHRLGLPEDVVVSVHILKAVIDGRPTIDELVEMALSRKAAHMQRLLEGAELLPWHLSPDPSVEAEGTDDDLAALLRFLLGEQP